MKKINNFKDDAGYRIKAKYPVDHFTKNEMLFCDIFMVFVLFFPVIFIGYVIYDLLNIGG